MAPQKHLLVFRFSSLGDVAMTVPVIKCLLKQHPQLQVTMVSTEFVRPLFNDIERLDFFATDLKGKHKGVTGLWKLYKELKATYRFDAVADLHNVLRTKILRTYFSFSRKKITAIDKGREEKKELTRQENKKLHLLKSTFQRYADVFALSGFPVELIRAEGIKNKIASQQAEQLKRSGYRLVGMAPFALHTEKTYPAQKMKEVVRMLTNDKSVKVFLFGGKKEAAVFSEWENELENVQSLAAKMNFDEELKFISQLDVMVSMDSANMHLASFFGVPVVSVWGGTHPYLGFYGWGQDIDNAVQIDLDCRPSSVFGNEPCRNNLACMNGISPLLIYERISHNLNKQL